MTRRASILDAVEPEPIAHMAPAEMERLNLDPGDMMRLSSRRGNIDIKVRQDNGVQAGMVFVPFCYAEAAVNLLTNDALDPIGKIAEVKYCAVKAEKLELGEAAQ